MNSSPPVESILREPTKCRVVVVDDDEDSAELVAALLATRGHTARIALSAAAALALLEAEQPDVVVLDVGLPDMDGLALARLIRERFGAKLRLVALTGYSGESQQAVAREAGVDAFLVKPVRVSQLDTAVGTCP